MSDLLASPTKDEESQFLYGECHVLAVALHRKYGWPLLVVECYDEPYWEDPEDPDNTLPSIFHVYALDETSGLAWDIRGARPENEVIQDVAQVFDTDALSLSTDTLYSEEELKNLVGYWADDGDEPIDRPLSAYDDNDVREASITIEGLLAPIIQQAHNIRCECSP